MDEITIFDFDISYIPKPGYYSSMGLNNVINFLRAKSGLPSIFLDQYIEADRVKEYIEAAEQWYDGFPMINDEDFLAPDFGIQYILLLDILITSLPDFKIFFYDNYLQNVRTDPFDLLKKYHSEVSNGLIKLRKYVDTTVRR